VSVAVAPGTTVAGYRVESLVEEWNKGKGKPPS
jgi:hypothetical protein